ncbi:MAG: hypothetical protein MZV63_55450 [Marinilabiliales bacterium]|nr:hypothetical protein [Marinilabiliales bacterium]
MISNIQEVKARHGKIIAVITEGMKRVEEPRRPFDRDPRNGRDAGAAGSHDPSLQLLSYHIAVMRECNVDQPRNLAKSVTVE